MTTPGSVRHPAEAVPGTVGPRRAPRLPGAAADAVLAVTTGLVALATYTHRLAVPAMWPDESATVAAVRRTGAAADALLGGPETPLVPYYTLQRLVLGPAAEVGALRLVSAAAWAVAAAALVGLLLRAAGRTAGLAGAAALLCSPGVLRQAQEARPYALACSAVAVAFLAWWWMAVERRARRAAGAVLAVCCALAAVAHLVCVVIGPVLVVATLVATTRRRARAAAATAAVVGSGLAVVAPWLALAAVRGTGPEHLTPISWTQVAMTAAGAAGGGRAGVAAGVWTAVTAALGVCAAVDPSRRRLALAARLGVLWVAGVVALLLLCRAAGLSFVAVRYFALALPGWILLCGIGVAWAVRVVATAGRRSRTRTTTGGVLACALVATLVVPTQGRLATLRSPDGHGEDARWVVQVLQGGTQPVVVPSRIEPSILAAYDPGLVPRLVGWRPEPLSQRVWGERMTAAENLLAVADADRVALAVRTAGPTRTCAPTLAARPGVGRDVLRTCMPVGLGDGWTVTAVLGRRDGWVLAVLDREPQDLVRPATATRPAR